VLNGGPKADGRTPRKQAHIQGRLDGKNYLAGNTGVAGLIETLEQVGVVIEPERQVTDQSEER
jgi:hypothetical protein